MTRPALRRAARLAALSLAAASGPAAADLWHDTAQAIGYAATVRASLGPPCAPDNLLRLIEPMSTICPHRHAIPDAVLDAVAIRYLPRYVTPGQARQAIAFWSSAPGRALLDKILREIATHRFDQLTEADQQLLRVENATPHARALKAMAQDRDLAGELVRAMKAYAEVLEKPAKASLSSP